MADNVAITAGTGTTVAADEVTINAVLVKAQRVKLVTGDDGVGADLPTGAGVVGAAGAAGSAPRVTLGSDDPVAAMLGAKADAKSTATDTTPVSAMSVLKQISASVQAPPSQAVTNAGTFAVQAAAAGDTAAGASDAGNPVKIGGVGKTANPTAVTDGQRVNALFDKLGKQIVVGAVRDLKGVQKTTISGSTSETTIVTQVASTFLDLYGLLISNTSGAACTVTIKDATAGTTRFTIIVPAGDVRGFTLPVDSAVPQAVVNTNWTATCSASVAAIEITALYVKCL